LINALYFLPLLLLKRNRKNVDEFTMKFDWNSVHIVFNILITFAITCFAWIFFRSKSIQDAYVYINRMLTNLHFNTEYFKIERYNYELLYLLLFFIVIEWNNRTKIEPISGKYSSLKIGLCVAVLLALGVYSDYKEFIYFQF
jgi:hypothetical protein